MEMRKTPLHVVFVDKDRRVLREVYSECFLTRNTGIPHIHIIDDMILDMLDLHCKMPMMFYDIKEDKFNFKVSNIMDISKHPENDPDEIILEILEVRDDSGDVVEYIHLEPGLWKEDEDGRYRMCDDSMLHIIMDTKIIPMIKSETIEWNDGGAMTLLCHLERNLSFIYFDRSGCDDDYDDDDDEDCPGSGDCDDCEFYDEEKESCTCHGCDFGDDCDCDCDEYDDCDDCPHSIKNCKVRCDGDCDRCIDIDYQNESDEDNCIDHTSECDSCKSDCNDCECDVCDHDHKITYRDFCDHECDTCRITTCEWHMSHFQPYDEFCKEQELGLCEIEDKNVEKAEDLKNINKDQTSKEKTTNLKSNTENEIINPVDTDMGGKVVNSSVRHYKRRK